MKLPNTVGRGLSKFRDDFFKAVESGSEQPGLATGFKILDQVLGGVDPGFHVIVGDTTVGKSTFVNQLVDQMAAKNDDAIVIVYPFEQSKDVLVAKSLARRARVDSRDISKRAGSLRAIRAPLETAFRGYQEAAKRLIYVEGRAGVTVDLIEEHVGRARAKHRADRVVVVVDSLQALPDTQIEDRRIGVETAVRRLQQLALDQEVAIFAVSEIARSGGVRAGLRSAKESGSIEFSAGLVFSLNSAGQGAADSPLDKAFTEALANSKVRAGELDLVTMRVEKNRDGAAGLRIPFLFFKRIARFEVLGIRAPEEVTATTLNERYEDVFGAS